MPADQAQSKGLRGIFPAEARILCGISWHGQSVNRRRHAGVSMPTRRTVIFAFLCAAPALLAPTMGAAAGDATALAFVTDIYAAYKGKDAKGHPLDDERAIRRFFEPALAALMVKDQRAAAKRGEVGLLDFDPFIDAQDWDIANVDIAVDDTAAGKTNATVKFTNFDKPVTVRLDLIRIKNDWRIGDITWTRDGKADNLRKIYGR
jgi:hypothetical protein